MRKRKGPKARKQSVCVICKMRVQRNGSADFDFEFWGHSRYPMDHPATPNRKAIKWYKKGII
jgi:hypothetical protein